MKKQVSRILSAIIICCTFILALSFTVFADSYLSVSGSSGTVGGTVSVSLSISGDISGYQAVITYDSSAMEFSSASGGVQLSANGAGGAVSIVDYQNGTNTGPMSCTLVFTAKKAGTYTVGVSNFFATDGNGDGVTSSSGSGTVTISAPPTASSDANLSSLSISPGSLYPAFSAGTTYYSATVSASTTRLTVSAIPNDSAASVYVSGASSLSVGQNSVYVTVTAEDGTQKTYTINVTRNSDTTNEPDDPDNPDDTENPNDNQDIYVTVGGNAIMKVSPTIDPAIVPSGFVLIETQIDGKTVQALSYADDAPLVLYLISDDGAIQGFYFYNAETGDCTPMTSISQPAFSFTALDQNSATPPVGYVLGTFTIGDVTYAAFVPNGVENPDHCLIYGVNSSGTIGFYIYDALDGTFQRYRFEDTSQIVIPEKDDTEENEPVNTDTNEEQDLTPSEKLSALFSDPFTRWLMIGLAALIVVLLVLAIVFIVLYRKKAVLAEGSKEAASYSSDDLYEPPTFDTTAFAPVSGEQVTAILNDERKTDTDDDTKTVSLSGTDDTTVTDTPDSTGRPEPVKLEDIQFDIPDFGGAGASIPEVKIPDTPDEIKTSDEAVSTDSAEDSDK